MTVAGGILGSLILDGRMLGILIRMVGSCLHVLFHVGRTDG